MDGVAHLEGEAIMLLDYFSFLGQVFLDVIEDRMSSVSGRRAHVGASFRIFRSHGRKGDDGVLLLLDRML